MEASLGVRLLDTTSGGRGGGRGTLSPAAEEFMRKYQQVRAGLDDPVGQRFKVRFNSPSG
jgi:molybdate transport repressor ModE-like protein